MVEAFDRVRQLLVDNNCEEISSEKTGPGRSRHTLTCGQSCLTSVQSVASGKPEASCNA